MTEKRKATAIRLTPETDRLIRELAEKLSISRSAVIEMGVRLLGEKTGVRPFWPEDDEALRRLAAQEPGR